MCYSLFPCSSLCWEVKNPEIQSDIGLDMVGLCPVQAGWMKPKSFFDSGFFSCNFFTFSKYLVTLPCQPEELTNVLEICNIVFTSMFSLEMILKLTAFGSFNYLRNPYNVFDGVIVIIR